MEEIRITPQILKARIQSDSDQITTSEQINIFLQIKEIQFDTYKSKYIDEMSKKILRKSIQTQYEEFHKIVYPLYLSMEHYDDYAHVNWLDSFEENPNPLEHCMINNLIYPKNGTSFMNWYSKGIVDYLENIGFVANMDKIKQIVQDYLKNPL